MDLTRQQHFAAGNLLRREDHRVIFK